MVHDKKAEELEKRGLWRRAANRWGELLQRAASDAEREYVTERRSACIRRAALPPRVQSDDVCAIRAAATRTLADMGIDYKKEDPYRGTRYGRTAQDKRQG